MVRHATLLPAIVEILLFSMSKLLRTGLRSIALTRVRVCTYRQYRLTGTYQYGTGIDPYGYVVDYSATKQSKQARVNSSAIGSKQETAGPFFPRYW